MYRRETVILEVTVILRANSRTKLEVILKLRPPPPPYLPAPNASSSECAAYSSVLVVADVVEVNVIMGAGMGSLVVHAVEMNAIMGAGMRSLVSCFAVNNSNLAVVEVFIRML